MKKYQVTFNLNDTHFNIKVNANNEWAAREKAKRELYIQYHYLPNIKDAIILYAKCIFKPW